MEILKQEIASTILMPDFLYGFRSEHKDVIVEKTWRILDAYFKCVDVGILSDRKIRFLQRKVWHLSSEITDLTPPHLNLQIWLWIGETIEKWIDFAVVDEEFESAANLKKMLEGIE
jgi:hypothetical protein